MPILDCIKAASDAFGIPVADILGPSQSHPRCRARMAAIYMAREKGCGVCEIAMAVKRSPSPVSKTCARIEGQRARDPQFAVALHQAMREVRLA